MKNRRHSAIHLGNRPESRSRIKSYEVGRVCVIVGCSIELSRYNPVERCWSHRERRAPRLRAATLEERLSKLPVCEICDSHKQNDLVHRPEEIEFNGVLHIRGFDGAGLSCEELAMALDFGREARTC